MREIKFRAWDKYDSRMFEVDTIDFKSGALTERTKPGISTPHLPEDCTLMQYTGLKDKNGKEIFEGDIFNCIYHQDGHTDKYEVVYHPRWTGFFLRRIGECSQTGVHQTVSDVARYEVIGNIHENPELLK
jgi:uncharacterized phage protein (TIGR01671 family)